MDLTSQGAGTYWWVSVQLYTQTCFIHTLLVGLRTVIHSDLLYPHLTGGSPYSYTLRPALFTPYWWVSVQLYTQTCFIHTLLVGLRTVIHSDLLYSHLTGALFTPYWWVSVQLYTQTSFSHTVFIQRIRNQNIFSWGRIFLVSFVLSNLDVSVSESGQARF